MTDEGHRRQKTEYTADDIQRAVFRFLGDLGREVSRSGIDIWPTKSEEAAPRSEVFEDEENVHVLVDLPGVEEEDIDISLTSDYLTVKGERKPPKDHEEKKAYRREFGYGEFRTRIKLPCAIEADKADAELKSGVLRVKLPKKEKDKAVKVNVKKRSK